MVTDIYGKEEVMVHKTKEIWFFWKPLVGLEGYMDIFFTSQ